MNYREFVQRVSAKAGLLATLREAVSPKEVRDMFSQLPQDMLALFSTGAAGRTA